MINWCYHDDIFVFSLQTEKSVEGAGPLRSVKSDGQADERTTTVNSVSQIVCNGQDQRNSVLLCVCDSCFQESFSKQTSRNCGSVFIFSWWLFFILAFQFFISDTLPLQKNPFNTLGLHRSIGSDLYRALQCVCGWVVCGCVRHHSDSSTATVS